MIKNKEPNKKYEKKLNKINEKLKKYSDIEYSSTSKNNNTHKPIYFDKKISKSLIILSIIMIFIHILGLIYQIVSNQSTLCILLKELFILFYIIQIVMLKLKFKYTKYTCYCLHVIIILISLYYMDISNTIISILTIFYLYNLNNNFNFSEKNK
jgi:hypothetical protein